MEHVKRFISTLEHLVSTKTKKHIVGGILLSTSIFLGGLALTVMSTKIEDNEEQDEYDESETY